MAHYRIKEGESGVAVEVTALAGRGEGLMQAIGACQAGECSCPTDECQKMASLEVDQWNLKRFAGSERETGD